jgi:hypothetical protein
LKRHAKVAAQRVAHVEQILLHQRAIQPVLAEIIRFGFGGERHFIFVVRSAGDGVHEQKDDHAHDEEYNQNAAQTAKQISRHEKISKSPISNLG